MLEQLAKYYDYYHVKPIEGRFDVIQNPGAKTVDSLMSKVVRSVEIYGNKDFSLGKVTDMARCSILFDSYKDIPDFLLKLKQKVPSLTGYISRTPSGYRGIHLNFEINGIKTEIQLSTQKAWEVKQLTEHCYSKWRDFNINEELLKVQQATSAVSEVEGMIQKNGESSQLFELLMDKIKVRDSLSGTLASNLRLQAAENQMTKSLYEELHSDGEFASVEGQIESILLSMEATKNQFVVDIPWLNDSVPLDENGKVNMEQTRAMAQRAHDMATDVQTNLINSIQEALRENDREVYVDNDIKKGMQIVQNVMNEYNRALEEKLNGNIDLYNNNINLFSYQRYNIAVGATKYALANGIDPEDTSAILKGFFSDLEQNPQNYAEGDYSMNHLVTRLLENQRHYEGASTTTKNT